PLEREPVRDLQAPIAADRDQRLESARVEGAAQVVGAVVLVFRALFVEADVAKRVAPVGGAEDGAAQVGDAADLVGPELHDALEAQQALEPALDPVGAPPALVRREHHRANHGIEAGGVAPAGGYGYAHLLAGSFPLGDEVTNLSRFGVAPERLLGEAQ